MYMKIDEVPQDNGMIGNYGHEVCYAVDEEGNYTLSPSLGWEAKNIVNDQAWEVIIADTMQAHRRVLNGELSPVAYYQAKHQMDLGLLAKYAGLSRLRVWRHRKKAVFQKLSDDILGRYCKVFGVTLDELRTVPEKLTPELIRRRP